VRTDRIERDAPGQSHCYENTHNPSFIPAAES